MQISHNYTYIRALPSLRPLPHPIPPGDQRAPYWAPCAIEHLLSSYPSYTF